MVIFYPEMNFRKSKMGLLNHWIVRFLLWSSGFVVFLVRPTPCLPFFSRTEGLHPSPQAVRPGSLPLSCMEYCQSPLLLRAAQTPQSTPGLGDQQVCSFRHFPNLVFLFHFWSRETFMLLLGLATFYFDFYFIFYLSLLYVWSKKGILSINSIHFHQKLVNIFHLYFTDLVNAIFLLYTLNLSLLLFTLCHTATIKMG